MVDFRKMHADVLDRQIAKMETALAVDREALAKIDPAVTPHLHNWQRVGILRQERDIRWTKERADALRAGE